MPMMMTRDEERPPDDFMQVASASLFEYFDKDGLGCLDFSEFVAIPEIMSASFGEMKAAAGHPQEVADADTAKAAQVRQVSRLV